MSARRPSMPVFLNARAAVRVRIGGVERWAREMARRLPALAPERYVVVRPPAALAFRAGHAWEQVILPARAARARAALVYSPANLAPVAWPRNALLIHDASALLHPEWYSRPYALAQRALVPRAARRARVLMTVSEFSRGELADALGIPAERIAVVAGGVDDRFRPHADPGPALAALRLQRPYVLTVATPGPRKNLAALGPAARALAAEGIDLVAAGAGRPYLDAEAADGVRALGYVPDEHLPGLYAGARGFVLPSRHEGFGLTCLEAMGCGVPVVAARAGALPDTCGSAALLVDPEDHEGMADALLRAVTDDATRNELIATGRQRAAAFTWDRAAAETHRLLTDAAG